MRNICFYLLLLLLPAFVVVADTKEQHFKRQNDVAVAPAASTGQDHQAIRQTLLHYLQGTSYNQQDQISLAFHPEADLLLAKANQPFWKVPLSDYVSWFPAAKAGQFNGRVGEILSIEVDGDIATAKAEILLPQKQQRFVDVFLLKRINQQWQIISKAATQQESIQSGQRILFILSSAHFHGSSKLPAGASFSEIVNAYAEFKQAGFTVDFISPAGGAVPLAYIDTSDPAQKAHLYNQDFMQALKHTRTARELNAADYRAVHYIGGSSAMYGVAEDPHIARLVMDIYQQHLGIISAVCHGTAGIVHLKTADGQYLVKGKRVSGYPDAFEKQDAAYYQQFPFKIQQTIESRGGLFRHGKAGAAYVEVDGRLITGTNFQSSAGVAKAIIALLQQDQSATTPAR
ncbi:nuclear transport factor 2 family protein [Rheinheimera sp.]|uniref:nuclear transport factor 2 family protein n=1 Tax=Rheinheimera sp. TaxID=1869214 RepID=UPI003D28EF27